MDCKDLIFTQEEKAVFKRIRDEILLISSIDRRERILNDILLVAVTAEREWKAYMDGERKKEEKRKIVRQLVSKLRGCGFELQTAKEILDQPGSQ